MDLDFVYKQLLDGHKACKTTLSLTQYHKKKIDWSNKHFIPQSADLQYCNDGQNKHYDVNILSVRQISIRSSCCDITCESG